MSTLESLGGIPPDRRPGSQSFVPSLTMAPNTAMAMPPLSVSHFSYVEAMPPPHWKQTIEGTSHCQTKPIASSSPSGKRSARRTQLLQISMQGCFTDESEGAWVTSSFQATRVNGNTCLHGYHFALHIILSCSSAYAFQERPWNQLTVNYLYQQVLQSVAQTLLHEGHLVLSRLCPRHVYK